MLWHTLECSHSLKHFWDNGIPEAISFVPKVITSLFGIEGFTPSCRMAKLIEQMDKQRYDLVSVVRGLFHNEISVPYVLAS